MSAKQLLIPAFLILTVPSPSFAAEFNFLAENFGKKFNNLMREAGLNDRISFIDCADRLNGDAGMMNACTFAYDGAKFFIWSPAPYHPATAVVVVSTYDASGAEAIQAAASGALMAIVNDLEFRDALEAVNTGLDRAADTGKFSSTVAGLKLRFRLSAQKHSSKVSISPVE